MVGLVGWELLFQLYFNDFGKVSKTQRNAQHQDVVKIDVLNDELLFVFLKKPFVHWQNGRPGWRG